jgi:hypothetical protein
MNAKELKLKTERARSRQGPDEKRAIAAEREGVLDWPFLCGRRAFPAAKRLAGRLMFSR